MEFSSILENLMNSRQITMYKLAKEIDVSEGTIRAWKKDKQPTADKLIKLSQFFTVSIDELLGQSVLEFSQEEKDIIDAFRKADIYDKETVRRTLNIKTQSEKEGKSSASKTG